MTGRATIDIIAELRDALGAGIYRPLTNEAADRLAELEAKVAAVNAALDQYDSDEAWGKFLAAIEKAVER